MWRFWFKKYVNGSRWLGRRKREGKDVSKDVAEFEDLVLNPTTAAFLNLTEAERLDAGRVAMVVKIFEGEVV